MTTEEITQLLNGEATDVWTEGAYRKYIRLGDAQKVAEKIRAAIQTTIDKQTIQLAEKDAKIYAYETIIANSNFKAVLPRAKGGEK